MERFVHDAGPDGGSSPVARCAILAVWAIWTIAILSSANVPGGDPGSRFLHGVLLPFHEAGHVFFMPFGEFVGALGGTIGQLLMPLAIAIALFRTQSDRFGALVFVGLLGFSILDVAVYMYDAYDPRLILLGGATGAETTGHDWERIFSSLGILRSARGIGVFSGILGRLVMIASIAAAAWITWKDWRIGKDSPKWHDSIIPGGSRKDGSSPSKEDWPR